MLKVRGCRNYVVIPIDRCLKLLIKDITEMDKCQHGQFRSPIYVQWETTDSEV
jgi:hypothetical protein